MVKVAQVIKERRLALGLSQAELGALVGMQPRQIRRYEAGEVQPSFAGAKLLADALHITLDELAGDDQVDLSGEWWSAWQGLERSIQLQLVLLIHQGNKVEINTPPADPRGAPNALPWRGELTVVEGGALGWYVLNSVHRGVLSVAAQDQSLVGYWVTAKGFRPGPSGFMALARTGERAIALVETERGKGRTRWEAIDPHDANDRPKGGVT